MIEEDYSKVGVPMMPVVNGMATTANQTFIYTLLLLPVTLLLVYPLKVSGALYASIAIVLWVQFIHKAWQLTQTPDDKQMARSVFKFSILYMMLLCAGMGVDSLPWTQQIWHHSTHILQAWIPSIG